MLWDRPLGLGQAGGGFCITVLNCLRSDNPGNASSWDGCRRDNKSEFDTTMPDMVPLFPCGCSVPVLKEWRFGISTGVLGDAVPWYDHFLGRWAAASIFFSSSIWESSIKCWSGEPLLPGILSFAFIFSWTFLPAEVPGVLGLSKLEFIEPGSLPSKLKLKVRKRPRRPFGPVGVSIVGESLRHMGLTPVGVSEPERLSFDPFEPRLFWAWKLIFEIGGKPPLGDLCSGVTGDWIGVLTAEARVGDRAGLWLWGLLDAGLLLAGLRHEGDRLAGLPLAGLLTEGLRLVGVDTGLRWPRMRALLFVNSRERAWAKEKIRDLKASQVGPSLLRFSTSTSFVSHRLPFGPSTAEHDIRRIWNEFIFLNICAEHIACLRKQWHYSKFCRFELSIFTKSPYIT